MKNSTKNGSSEMMIESGSDFSLVYRQWFGHQLWPALCTSYVWALPSAYPLLVHQWRGGSYPGEVVSEIWVKSGEELSQLFTTRKRPVYRYFRRMGEEWRVFHDSIVYSDLEIKNPWCWSLFSISYCRFYYAVWTANWQIWWQLSVLGKTVSCSGSASLLFYVNS